MLSPMGGKKKKKKKKSGMLRPMTQRALMSPRGRMGY
jgi:hypothetical protein